MILFFIHIYIYIYIYIYIQGVEKQGKNILRKCSTLASPQKKSCALSNTPGFILKQASCT